MKNKVTNFMKVIAKTVLTTVIMLTGFAGKTQNAPCDARFELKTDGYKIAVSSLLNQTGFEYLWNFGDGTFDKRPNAEHTYPKEGVYSVCLIVKREPVFTNTKNERGCADTICKRVEITKPCRLAVDFEFEVRGTVAHFTNKTQSNATHLVYKWEFGNNRTSDNPNPEFDFKQAGQYKVCLTVASRDGKCRETVCKVVEIKPNPCHGLQASFNHKQKGLKALFVSTAKGNNLVYEWTIDGRKASENGSFRHVFKEPGRYTVCLVVKIKGTNCVSRVCKVIEVKKPDPCERLQAAYRFKQKDMKALFVSTTKSRNLVYEWTINGRKVSEKGNFRFTFTEPGRYTVCLVVKVKGTNCVSRVCKVIEVKKPNPCRVNAAFRYVVLGHKVALNNLSKGNNLTYEWSVDGKTVSNRENLSVELREGKHRVCLTVSNGHCKNTYCTVIEIKKRINRIIVAGNSSTRFKAEEATGKPENGVNGGQNTPAAQEIIMAVYPNPAQEVLNLTINGAENATVVISSLNGTLYYNQKHIVANAQAIGIQIGHLPQGYYIAKATSADGLHTATLKFYKQ